MDFEVMRTELDENLIYYSAFNKKQVVVNHFKSLTKEGRKYHLQAKRVAVKDDIQRLVRIGKSLILDETEMKDLHHVMVQISEEEYQRYLKNWNLG